MNNSFDQLVWDKIVVEQRNLCARYDAQYYPIDPFQIVGLSEDISQIPFHGLRHPLKNATGWFLWCGEYKPDDDFFKAHHALHLMDIKPNILKFLGLGPGHRFLVDNHGYEDVWFDKDLLDIE